MFGHVCSNMGISGVCKDSLASPTLAHSCSLVGWIKTGRTHCHVWTIHLDQLLAFNYCCAVPALLRLEKNTPTYVLNGQIMAIKTFDRSTEYPYKHKVTVTLMVSPVFFFYFHFLLYFIWRFISYISDSTLWSQLQQGATFVCFFKNWKHCVYLFEFNFVCSVTLSMCSMCLLRCTMVSACHFHFHTISALNWAKVVTEQADGQMIITSWVCFVKKQPTKMHAH